jgi:hypothetical protein
MPLAHFFGTATGGVGAGLRSEVTLTVDGALELPLAMVAGLTEHVWKIEENRGSLRLKASGYDTGQGAADPAA